MRKLFNDILGIEGVKGVVLFSFSGDIIFQEFSRALSQEPARQDWHEFIEALNGMRETDLIFEKGRIYIRKTDIGYLIVLMGLFVSIAMLRLNCDILLPSLKPAKSSRKRKRFFGR